MNELIRGFVDDTVQCWGCPVFDRLFRVVSDAAAAVYGKFAALCTILLCVLLAFYIINAVWENIKNKVADPWYQKTARPAIIGAFISVALLGMGVALPRFITTVTFEPTAQIALIYTQSMIETDNETVNQHVSYTPTPMDDTGFYRPELRDLIIQLMKTTITQFQSYMKLGIAVMDAAFSWRALLGIGSLIKHILWFVMGLYLFYEFFRLFVRFCFYFADVIVAMAFFAFFFPLSVTMLAFKGADKVPSWMSGIGKKLGADQFKSLINAIIGLAAAVLTYVVIMAIIAKFFSDTGTTNTELMSLILSGDVYAADLSEDNLASMTLMGAVVLVYVLNFVYSQIPQVTKMVLAAFNVESENKISEQLANDAMRVTGAMLDTVKKAGATIISGGEKKDDKSGKKDDKKGGSK